MLTNFYLILLAILTIFLRNEGGGDARCGHNGLSLQGLVVLMSVGLLLVHLIGRMEGRVGGVVVHTLP